MSKQKFTKEEIKEIEEDHIHSDNPPNENDYIVIEETNNLKRLQK